MYLKDELEKFWRWANKDPLEYSKNRGFGEWEIEYPDWYEIYKSVELEIIYINKNSDISKIHNILEAIAIDNESEYIIDLCEEKILNIELFIKEGYKFYQPETRWQIAELIRKIQTKDYVIYLEEMLNDENEYVRKRALNALKYLKQ